MKIAQWILVCLLLANFLRTLYQDINGRPEMKPPGFVGVISTLIVTVLIVILYWQAGALSQLLPE